MNRRDFTASLGKFALCTPPAITLLLNTSMTGEAIAKSGGNENPRGRGRRGNREPRTDRNHGAENFFGN